MNPLVSLRADFFNLHLLVNQPLKDLLQGFCLRLKDMHGNTLLNYAKEDSSLASCPINLAGTDVALIEAKAEDLTLLKKIISHDFEKSFAQLLAEHTHTKKEILAQDLEALLDISEEDNLSLNELLQHFLKIVRAHTIVENTAIFGIYDGFTLEGMAAVGALNKQNNDQWKMEYSKVAGISASQKKPFVSENPGKDPQLKSISMEGLRNILCFPLLHGENLVGVLTLSNKLGGVFTLEDQEIVRRFSLVATHILQKHYFKKKMESFAKTSDHLGKYLSSKVVKSVKDTKDIALGGAEKKVVVLFSDIRSFTTITEGIEAQTLVKLLNFYFDHMSAIIDKHEGTLDKIVGDLIMAVWNIPNDQPQPELLAMKTALEMQKEMIRVVGPEWNRHGVAKVGMGIGVNAGMAVAGNLGSQRFMNYTVVGDSINTAQRLEARATAGEIWMAEHLFEHVNGKIEKPVRKEVDIQLKGKEKNINAYVYRPLSY